MSTDESIAAYRMSRKVRTGGSQAAAIIIGLLGLVLLLLFWPLGLLLMVIAYFADAKYGKAHYCGSCGNDVTVTSRLCPTCHSQLVEPDLSMRAGNALRQAAVTVLTLILITIIVVLFIKNR